MQKHKTALSPHCQNVLAALKKSSVPLSAYALLEKLQKFGIKAPPTVYRALDTLMERGLVHRIESLGAFIACHDHDDKNAHAQFMVCTGCKTVEEIHDNQLTMGIRKLAASLKFHVEREMLEIMGLCSKCSPSSHKKA